MSEAQDNHHLFGVVVHRKDSEGVWNSRWHRKGRTEEHTAARAISWAVALSFLIGSTLFIVGGIGAFGEADWVRWVYLVGSVVFSGGTVLVLVEARAALVALHETPTIASLWKNPGGRAALVQLPAAAFFFQLSTIAGAVSGLDVLQTNVFLWTPSTIGAAGFVAASAIAVRECTPARDVGTLSAGVNLGGSIGFLVGSLTGFLSESPVDLDPDVVSNPMFLLGSTLFFIGSALAIVELRTPPQRS